MMVLTKDSLLRKVFSDPKNYPYGFSRSGDFSIAESKALVEYGCLIAALVDGQLHPQGEEDESIIAAAHGAIEPQDTKQRAWLKYQKRINRPKTGSIHGTKKVRNENIEDHDEPSDIDDIIVDTED
ncbi:DUF413 domain-containing protein [Glaciecola petra]|uniref:Macrodomain Ori protein n=1 Tax=Glaciecola petra TaxID=3075602 RepID=A0ABU2ZKX5_9ALTE|nr:DUF413 domain-containing protein [Aestuariibacter sp. P117]MDT0593268.1 DUF413 domain-containing protein [Aestuariibacter sp. P117]